MRSLNTTSALLSLIILSSLTVVAAPSAKAEALLPNQELQSPSQRYADITKAQDPSYRRLIIPMLARVGCSARECHGSFQGRGGFQLSLFGSEWNDDYVQLTQKKGGEDEIRINAKEPEKSLILMKPTLQMKHKGKERFKKDSWQYNAILKWIQGGAKTDAGQTGELDRLEVTPAEVVFSRLGQPVQLRVLAHWNDGVVEDVTEITRFKSNDETVASVSEAGLITSTGKGDSHIIASYDNGVLPIPVLLPVSEMNGSKFPATTPKGKVDELVVNKLRKMGIVPAEVCTDGEFLRRVSLDLTGTLPTAEEVTKFLDDKNPNKRSAKIDELFRTPAYSAWWATKFSDYTGNNTRQLNLGPQNFNKGSTEVSRQWYEWLQKRIAENMPYDQIVSNIVLATSRSSPDQQYKDYVVEMDSYFRSDKPANFANHPTLPYYWQRRTVQSPEEKALAFSHTFLGVRLECAQCHKHPFDRWTKLDFKEFTAFFGVVAVGNRPALPNEQVSYASITQELKDYATALADKEDAESSMSKDKNGDDAKGKDSVKGKGSPDAKSVDAKSGADAKSEISNPKSKDDKSADAKTDPKSDTSNPKPKEGEVAKAKDGTPIDPKTGLPIKKVKVADLDQKKDQKVRKLINDEFVHRIETGGLVPWSEVFANTSNVKVTGKGNKGGNVNPSIQPKVLGGEVVEVPKGTDSRQPLMDWLRSKSNPYFAKAIVNRVWASYFNRGIVDPPDDLNIANAPANAELFTYLTDGFVAHGYDLQWLHREILNSDTYQRSWRTNPTNEQDIRNFSHAVVRQLPAEVMLDALDRATSNDEVAATYASDMEIRAIGPGGARPGGKKGGGGGPDGYFLTLFGKPDRITNCDCERSADPTLLQTIFTRNDPSLLARIDGSRSWISELRAQKNKGQSTVDIDKAITATFLRTVSRPPTSEELSNAKADVAAAKDPVDGIRDLLWAMVNTREFKVNH